MNDPTKKEAPPSSSITSSLPNNNNEEPLFEEEEEEEDDDDDDRPSFMGYPWVILGKESSSVKKIEIPRQVWSLLAGGVAGMVAKSVVAPVDRIKILFQTSSTKFEFRKLPQVALRIIQQEGYPALWKGNTATMIRVFPYAGIQFMVFDACKTHMLQREQSKRQAQKEQTSSFPHHDTTTLTAPRRRFSSNKLQKHATMVGLTPLESLMAGSIAGAVSVTCTYPLDLTRAQLAVLKRQKHDMNPGFTSILTRNYQRGGLIGLFRGITPTILGILPYSGVAFAMNEQAKHYIYKQRRREPTTAERMQCGALAGLCAQTITYPLEVTRRRMQTIGLVSDVSLAASTNGNSATKHVQPPNDMVTTIRYLWQEQGLRGFFKGVSMNWIKGPVAFSISFTTFDVVQKWVLKEQAPTR